MSTEDLIREVQRLQNEIGTHAVKCDRIVKTAIDRTRVIENALRQIVIQHECEAKPGEKCNCPVCVANSALRSVDAETDDDERGVCDGIWTGAPDDEEVSPIPDVAKEAWEAGQYGLAYGFVCRHPRRMGSIREGFRTGCGECERCEELDRVMKVADVKNDASCEKMWKDMTPDERRQTLMNNFETKYPKKTWKSERLDVVLYLRKRSELLKNRGGDVLFSDSECKIVAATLRAEAEDIERGDHEEPYDD